MGNLLVSLAEKKQRFLSLCPSGHVLSLQNVATFATFLSREVNGGEEEGDINCARVSWESLLLWCCCLESFVWKMSPNSRIPTIRTTEGRRRNGGSSIPPPIFFLLCEVGVLNFWNGAILFVITDAQNRAHNTLLRTKEDEGDDGPTLHKRYVHVERKKKMESGTFFV